MAYCRWGCDGSDVYVFDGGHLICCTCMLREGLQDDDFVTSSRQAMIDHLDEHRAAGHVVTDDPYERLRREIADIGDEVKR